MRARIFRLLGCLIVGSCLVAPASAKKVDSETAASGIREALSFGVDHAVAELGRPDGFAGNPDVRIELPGDMRSLARFLKLTGYGAEVEEFETSMNRAAEAAVPVAKDIFIDAIRSMRFRDVWKVLTGGEHAGTEYLREHAGPRLEEAFLPIVKEKLDAVGATRDFDALMRRTADLPLTGGRPLFDLPAHVTDEALDGVFLLVEREEEAIRANPLKRGTALLRKVFGSKQAKRSS